MWVPGKSIPENGVLFDIQGVEGFPNRSRRGLAPGYMTGREPLTSRRNAGDYPCHDQAFAGKGHSGDMTTLVTRGFPDKDVIRLNAQVRAQAFATCFRTVECAIVA